MCALYLSHKRLMCFFSLYFLRDCFLKYAIHKFRSTIGKARMVKPNESVVLAFSGGLSSSCMIQLVKQGLEVSQSHNMRMIFKPILLYIEGTAF